MSLTMILILLCLCLQTISGLANSTTNDALVNGGEYYLVSADAVHGKPAFVALNLPDYGPAKKRLIDSIGSAAAGVLGIAVTSQIFKKIPVFQKKVGTLSLAISSLIGIASFYPLLQGSAMGLTQAISSILSHLKLDEQEGVPFTVLNTKTSSKTTQEFSLRNIWSPDHPQYGKYLGMSDKNYKQVKLQDWASTIVAYPAILSDDPEAVYLKIIRPANRQANGHEGWLWTGKNGEKLQLHKVLRTAWKFVPVDRDPIMQEQT